MIKKGDDTMSENKYYKQIAIASVKELTDLLGEGYTYYATNKNQEWEYLVHDQLKQVITNINNYITHSCTQDKHSK